MASFFQKATSALHLQAEGGKAPIKGYLDLPSAERVSDPLTLRIEGWTFSKKPNAPIVRVTFSIDGVLIGETNFFHQRPDVNAAHELPLKTKAGFSRVLAVPEHAKKKRVKFTVDVHLSDGSSYELTSRLVPLTGQDYRAAPFGYLLDPKDTAVRGREQMYSVGPSLSKGSDELLSLLKREFGSDVRSIVDVGCGLGIYGKALLASGYEWTGVEIKEEDLAELARAGLPHVRANGQKLPFPDESFDAALCVEVLEHVDGIFPFLSELARVTRKRVAISVPNVEIIPYLTSYAVVPWHMLASDHLNFFSRSSLEAQLKKYFRRAEVGVYAQCPLKTAEGALLHYNLFALAEK